MSTIIQPLVFVILLFAALISAPAQAADCGQLSAAQAIPANFGAAYNVLSPTKETLISTDCVLNDTANTVNATIGNGQNTQYIYKYGYFWRNNKWEALELIPQGQRYSDWLVGQAKTSITLTAEEATKDNFFLAYICSWTGTAWKCGCRDALCVQKYWQMQRFKPNCQENWSCTPWSACQNELETRTCTDANACGTTLSKPLQEQLCNASADCHDSDQDGYDSCAPGESGDDGKLKDCNDNEFYANPGLFPNDETCDTLDNDCNGQTDEGCDDDHDGYCDQAKTVYRNNSMCPQTAISDYAAGAYGTDCADNDNTAHPGGTEICGNGIDEDCSGTDEPCPSACGDASCNGAETCTTCPSDCGACPGDTVDPIVASFSVSPAALTPGQTLSASYSATDNTGLARSELWRAAQGTNCNDTVKTGCDWGTSPVAQKTITGPSSTGTLTDTPASGTYYYGLHVVDTSGRIGYEPTPAKVTVSPAPVCGDASCNGTETCTTCSSDCGACAGDTTNPVVASFSVSPATLTQGNAITASYSASDNTGLVRIELWRAPAGTNCTDTVKTGCVWFKAAEKAVSGTANSGTISEIPGYASTFYYGLHAVDASGNYGAEPAAAKVVVSADLSTGNVYFIKDGGTAASKSTATGPCANTAATMSVSKHNSQIFAPGDTIYICGTIKSGISLIPPSSGSLEKPIVYRGDYSGYPALFNQTFIYPDLTRLIYIQNKQYIILSSLNLDANTNNIDGNYAGVWIEENGQLTGNIEINNCLFQKTVNGVFARGDVRNIKVYKSVFRELTNFGITLYTYYGRSDNIFPSYVTIGGSRENGNTFVNVGYLGCSDWKVCNLCVANVCQSGDSSGGVPGSAVGTQADDLVFSYNHVYADKAGWGGGGAYLNGVDRVLIENNYIHDLDAKNRRGPISVKSDFSWKNNDIIIRFNKIGPTHGGGLYTDPEGGIRFNNCLDNVMVYGNLIKDVEGFGIYSTWGWESAYASDGCIPEDVYVYSNIISKTNSASGIYLAGTAGTDYFKNFYVTNNLVYHAANTNVTDHPSYIYGIQFLGSDQNYQGVTVQNNIIDTPGYQSSKKITISALNQSDIRYDYNHHYFTGFIPNVYYTNSDCMACAWNSASRPSAYGIHDSAGDPFYVNAIENNFALRQDSFCRNSGLKIDTVIPSVTIQGRKYDFSFGTALDPVQTDWSTLIPTVVMADQNANGSWEKGPYVYLESSQQADLPVVSVFNISPAILVQGQSVTASYTVTDNTGLVRVELWRAPAGTNCTDTIKTGCVWGTAAVVQKTISGTTNSGTLTNIPATAGTFYYGLHAVDSAGNVGYEPISAKIKVTADSIHATANPDSISDAKSLLNYLYTLPAKTGNKVISGHSFSYSMSRNELEYDEYIETIADQTGHYVGIIGTDLMFGPPDGVLPSNWADTKLKEYWNNGGLVTLSWHAVNPVTLTNASDRNINFSNLVIKGTAENIAWKKQLDSAAAALSRLRDEGVVVLWRPFHEMQGTWWWWGKRSDYAKIWRYMFDYFNDYYHLDNLLWVYSTDHSQGASALLNYYPGDDYVDIVGISYYEDDVKSSFADYYNALKISGKPVVFSEIGLGKTIAHPVDYNRIINGIKNYAPDIVYFVAWHDDWSMTNNSNMGLLLNDSWIANRSDIIY